VFTRPWTMASPSPLRRQRAGRNFDGENTCHEQNVDIAHMKNLYDQAHGGKAPWPPVYPQGPASASGAR